MRDATDRHWSVLRRLRAEPPGRAASGARRKTFTTALGQSEELWSAARALTPATSPIVAYYAYSQAGRAISAAAVLERWEGLPSHGLKLCPPKIAGDARPALRQIKVKQHGKGLIDQVAGLLSSPTLNGETSLSALMQSLPDSEDLILQDDYPRPVSIHQSFHSQLDSGQTFLSVGPIPDHLVRRERTDQYVRVLSPSPVEVANWLASYPRLAALGEPEVIKHPNPMDLDQPAPQYAITAGWNAGELDLQEQYRWLISLIDVPTGPTSGLVLPAVGNNLMAVAPVLTYWILLYSFSMLARYHPRTWALLLDIDRNEDAVPIELVLKSAIDELPHLTTEVLLERLKL